MENKFPPVVNAPSSVQLRASSVRWAILRRALLSGSPSASSSSAQSDEQYQLEIKKISRKAAGGFNMIPFQHQNKHLSQSLDALPKDKGTVDACVCYTLPTEMSKKLIMFQRVENYVNLKDFEISDKYNIDNTGLVCCWPSEDILAFFCLTHADMFRSKRVLELGSGYGLAGLTIAVVTSAREVVISDGNPQVVDYIQRNIAINTGNFGNTSVQAMALHWNQELDSSMLKSFDIIVASDCTFFKEFHKSLALTVKSLLKHEDTSQALFLNPRRGGTLDNFLQILQETGLHYEVVENYDNQVWKRHIEIQNGNDKYWDNYDKDHCYPVLNLSKPMCLVCAELIKSVSLAKIGKVAEPAFLLNRGKVVRLELEFRSSEIIIFVRRYRALITGWLVRLAGLGGHTHSLLLGRIPSYYSNGKPLSLNVTTISEMKFLPFKERRDVLLHLFGSKIG